MATATATKEVRDGFTWLNPKNIKIWKNPRTERNAGFGLDEMNRLREDIRLNGQKLPLEVRILDGEWTLIAGERRWRCIMSLIEENAICFNRRNRKMEPASVVYAEVCCVETEVADNKEAMVAAVMENFLHAGLTDHEILQQCQLLEEAGLSRKELSEKLGKSEAWMSQTFSLLDETKCHPSVLEAMADGVLGRTQALQFLTFAPDKVEAILARAIERHQQALDAKEKEATDAADAALKEWEAHEEELRLAEEAEDTAAAAAARRKLFEAETKQSEAEDQIKKHKKAKGKKKKPQPSIQEIQDAAKDEDAEGSAQRHIPMKQVRQVSDRLTELLSSGEKLVNSDTEEPYNIRELRIIRDVMDWILSRNNLKSPLDALAYAEGEYPAEEFAAAK